MLSRIFALAIFGSATRIAAVSIILKQIQSGAVM